MKQLALAVLAALSFMGASAQPPAGNANPGDWYGDKIKNTNAVDIATIPAKLKENPTFNITVKAKVLDVCPKKGCWLKLAVNDSTTAFVKMKDYAFFLPTAIKGKTILLEGEVKQLTTSVEELQHYARDAKKSDAAIAAINEPKKEIRFTATGITVVP